MLVWIGKVHRNRYERRAEEEVKKTNRQADMRIYHGSEGG